MIYKLLLSFADDNQFYLAGKSDRGFRMYWQIRAGGGIGTHEGLRHRVSPKRGDCIGEPCSQPQTNSSGLTGCAHTFPFGKLAEAENRLRKGSSDPLESALETP